MKIIDFSRKRSQAERKLRVLTRREFDILDHKDPDGVYDRDTREGLYWTLEKLGEHFRKCTKHEKELYKRFQNAYFGIRIPEGTVWKGNIDHPGSIIIHGRFEGNIHSAKTVTLLHTASVVGEVFANQVLSQGRIEGDVKANQRVWLGPRARVLGDVVTPSIKMEEGAHLEGQCVMIEAKKIALPLPMEFKGGRASLLKILKKWSIPNINILKVKVFNIK
jgi:cytoskeletal protein CcmA (bactofilin family)